MTAKVIGSDAFYAQVATYDKNDQLLQQLTVTGHDEARATGLIAAFLIKKFMQQKTLLVLSKSIIIVRLMTL